MEIIKELRALARFSAHRGGTSGAALPSTGAHACPHCGLAIPQLRGWGKVSHRSR